MSSPDRIKNSGVMKRAIRRPRLQASGRMLFLAAGVASFAASGVIIYGLQNVWPAFKLSTEEFIARQIDARVQSILISGAEHTGAQELKDALAINKNDSLVGYDVATARQRLEDLPWIRAASVVRQLPSTLRVDIYEHKPLARLQMSDGNWVIDRDGALITSDTEGFDHLPLLKGAGAETQASALFSLLAAVPHIMKDLQGAEYIGQRRWDLFLANDVTVRLPEQDPARALQILSQLIARRNVLAVEGAIVDLRLDDRIVLRLPGASGDQYL